MSGTILHIWGGVVVTLLLNWIIGEVAVLLTDTPDHHTRRWLNRCPYWPLYFITLQLWPLLVLTAPWQWYCWFKIRK